ncbi:MAG TPA: hypothetical protein VGC45_15460 [Gryllotalpicola sp.]
MDESTMRRGRATTVIGLALALLFFFGGIALLGYAESVPGWQLWIFMGGIVSIAIAFFIPTTIVRRVDGV